MNMSKHIVIFMAVMLVAGAGHALPQPVPQATYATEAELLSAPGSAGYAVDGDFADVDDSLVPLCDGEGDEGEDGAEPDPGDGGDDGSDQEPDEGAESDDDVGC
jgi:hypothetical protein